MVEQPAVNRQAVGSSPTLRARKKVSRGGGTGRRTGLKILRWLNTVSVRFRFSAPIKKPGENDAGWSSLVARRAHNPKVGGSNPSPATIKNYIRPCGQAVKTPPFHGGIPSSILGRVTRMDAQLSWESICLTSRGSQVRALLCPPRNGLVVQLVRMPACHAGGRRFEPDPGRQ